MDVEELQRTKFSGFSRELADQLLQLLRQTLSSNLEVIDYQIGNQHHDYLVLLVQLQLPNMQVVVKLAGPNAPILCPFERTALLHHLVATQTTIAMPEILAVDTGYRQWPWRYIIKTFMPGVEWVTARAQMNDSERSSTSRQLGQAVAQLHSIRFLHFGELTEQGEVQGEASFLSALARRAQSLIKRPHLYDLFLAVLDKNKDLFKELHEPSLCHEDLHKHNLLFHYAKQQWYLTTILDFDKAWAGHSEIDLARLDLWQGMTGEDFWQGYEASHLVEALFSQRKLIHQLCWCLEYARPTTAHLADTQRLCRALDMPAIEQFDA